MSKSTWEKLHKNEATEWEHHAFEKCDQVNEEFLAHYFEPRFCLRCFKACEFSILRTFKDLPDGTRDIKERKWCTSCWGMAIVEKRNTGMKRYRRSGERRP